jgi:hypothetical protein
MPSLHTQISSDRAARYLSQFCKHAAAMGRGGHTPRMHTHHNSDTSGVRVEAEWFDTHGVVTFTPWGRATLDATDDLLTIRIDADNDGALSQIRDIITRDIKRFAGRNPLTVAWKTFDSAEPSGNESAAPPTLAERRADTNWPAVAVIAVVAAAVLAAHAIAAGTLIARWSAVTIAVAAVALVVNAALVIVVRRRGARAWHHRPQWLQRGRDGS